MIEYTCEKCGKLFESYPSNERKYCSNTCSPGPVTHGASYTRLYQIWTDMKNRCSNYCSKEMVQHYSDIHICSEWICSFETFRDWANANGYSDELTLDRIDGTKDYTPTNCRWATKSQQSQNTKKRYNGVSKYKGVTWHVQNRKWRAVIVKNGYASHLGMFDNEEDAAREYDRVAKYLFGPNCRTNF